PPPGSRLPALVDVRRLLAQPAGLRPAAGPLPLGGCPLRRDRLALAPEPALSKPPHALVLVERLRHEVVDLLLFVFHFVSPTPLAPLPAGGGSRTNHPRPSRRRGGIEPTTLAPPGRRGEPTQPPRPSRRDGGGAPGTLP